MFQDVVDLLLGAGCPDVTSSYTGSLPRRRGSVSGRSKEVASSVLWIKIRQQNRPIRFRPQLLSDKVITETKNDDHQPFFSDLKTVTKVTKVILTSFDCDWLIIGNGKSSQQNIFCEWRQTKARTPWPKIKVLILFLDFIVRF